MIIKRLKKLWDLSGIEEDNPYKAQQKMNEVFAPINAPQKKMAEIVDFHAKTGLEDIPKEYESTE